MVPILTNLNDHNIPIYQILLLSRDRVVKLHEDRPTLTVAIDSPMSKDFNDIQMVHKLQGITDSPAEVVLKNLMCEIIDLGGVCTTDKTRPFTVNEAMVHLNWAGL